MKNRLLETIAVWHSRRGVNACICGMLERRAFPRAACLRALTFWHHIISQTLSEANASRASGIVNVMDYVHFFESTLKKQSGFAKYAGVFEGSRHYAQS